MNLRSASLMPSRSFESASIFRSASILILTSFSSSPSKSKRCDWIPATRSPASVVPTARAAYGFRIGMTRAGFETATFFWRRAFWCSGCCSSDVRASLVPERVPLGLREAYHRASSTSLPFRQILRWPPHAKPTNFPCLEQYFTMFDVLRFFIVSSEALETFIRVTVYSYDLDSEPSALRRRSAAFCHELRVCTDANWNALPSSRREAISSELRAERMRCLRPFLSMASPWKGYGQDLCRHFVRVDEAAHLTAGSHRDQSMSPAMRAKALDRGIPDHFGEVPDLASEPLPDELEQSHINPPPFHRPLS